MTWINTLIAAFVAAVVYFQWRTAHQRVVLDLFDRRLRVFEDIEKAVRSVFASAQVTNETFRLFVEAKARARFLFSKDVIDYLEKLQKDFAWRLSFTDDAIKKHANRNALFVQSHEVLNRIVAFSEKSTVLFSPYMRLDQKLPSSWLPL
jgi:excinuclease UvrABC helicase subunit UvrB